MLAARLDPGRYVTASSRDIGLPLGVRALAVERSALPKGPPILTGGGTARLVGADWVMWAKAPDRFEAGTPAIINVIAFAKALRLTRHFGEHAFAGRRRRSASGRHRDPATRRIRSAHAAGSCCANCGRP